jgi:hypothetical protein
VNGELRYISFVLRSCCRCDCSVSLCVIAVSSPFDDRSSPSADQAGSLSTPDNRRKWTAFVGEERQGGVDQDEM